MNNLHYIKLQEQLTRDKQADIYDKNILLPLYEKFECNELLNNLNGTKKNILEIGCGTGRHTKKILKHNVVALDFSYLSLKKNKEKVCNLKFTSALPGNENLKFKVNYVQADAIHLTFKKNYFDVLCAFQVLEHFPGKKIIKQSIKEFHQVLKTKGSFIFSIYGYHFPAKLFLKKKGFHKGNIYYQRFTKSEIYNVLHPYFKIKNIKKDLAGYLLVVNAEKQLP